MNELLHEQEKLREINPKVYQNIWMLYTVDEREMYEKLYEVEKKIFFESEYKHNNRQAKLYDTYETFVDYQLECNMSSMLCEEIEDDFNEDEFIKDFNLMNLQNTLLHMEDMC